MTPAACAFVGGGVMGITFSVMSGVVEAALNDWAAGVADADEDEIGAVEEEMVDGDGVCWSC